MAVETISTKVGKCFAIRMEAVASGGYRWKFLPSDSTQIVKMLNENWEQKSGFGGTSVQIFNFQALSLGRAVLEFGYVRGRDTTNILKHCNYYVKISD